MFYFTQSCGSSISERLDFLPVYCLHKSNICFGAKLYKTYQTNKVNANKTLRIICESVNGMINFSLLSEFTRNEERVYLL